MQFEISKYRQLIFSLLILIFSFSILAYLIFAWTPPTQSPPQGNVPAPINVGDENQVKSGGFGAQTLASAYGAVFAYLGGKLGIGTTTPTYKLHVQGGDIFASGYVRGQTGLCIGSDCRTSWPSGGGGETYWAASGNNIYNTNSGNVGIGTTGPVEKLSVAGNIGLSGGNRFVGTIDNYALSLRTNNSDRIYITNSGNVGIGTTAPAYKLDVSGGDINVSGSYRKGGVAGISISCDSGMTPSGITISGGIVTGVGSCVKIPASAICTWNSKTYSTGARCYNGSIGGACYCGSLLSSNCGIFECQSDGSWKVVGSVCCCDLPTVNRCGE